MPHPAQHPVLAAAFGIAQSLPTAILVLGSLTVLQNTKINRCACAGVATLDVDGRSCYNMYSWRLKKLQRITPRRRLIRLHMLRTVLLLNIINQIMHIYHSQAGPAHFTAWK